MLQLKQGSRQYDLENLRFLKHILLKGTLEALKDSCMFSLEQANRTACLDCPQRVVCKDVVSLLDYINNEISSYT